MKLTLQKTTFTSIMNLAVFYRFATCEAEYDNNLNENLKLYLKLKTQCYTTDSFTAANIELMSDLCLCGRSAFPGLVPLIFLVTGSIKC